MVASTIAAVRGDDRKGRLRWAGWHLAGLAVGASALGGALSAFGAALSLPGRALAVPIGVLALVAGILALGGRKLRVPSPSAQVPLAWSYTMGPAQYAFAYGVGLGVGFLTRINSFSFYLLIGILLALEQPVVGVLLANLYALARWAPVLVAALAERSGDQMAEAMQRWRLAAFRGDGVIMLLIGGLLTVNAT